MDLQKYKADVVSPSREQALQKRICRSKEMVENTKAMIQRSKELKRQASRVIEERKEALRGMRREND